MCLISIMSRIGTLIWWLVAVVTSSILLGNLNSSIVSSEECPTFSCPTTLCELKLKTSHNFCESVTCVGIGVGNCSTVGNDGLIMYEEHLGMCGCCPGCVKYIALGEDCEQFNPPPGPDPNCAEKFCPILMHTCAPGMECPLTGPNAKKCTFLASSADGVMSSCVNKRSRYFNDDLHWTPACEPDGTYSPKQCKRDFSQDGVCFCVNKDGERIFGQEFRSMAENQTCACSRQVHEMREKGAIASLHCTPDGNYEALQCDTESGLCYCVEPKTGKTIGAVLPEKEWKNLQCFSYNYTNWDPDGGYYRLCESEWAVAQKLSKEAALHGLMVLSGRRITCDPDGSYAPVQNIDGKTKCVRKDGFLIMEDGEAEDLLETNCQCGRDEIWIKEQNNLPFHKACMQVTGNYAPISRASMADPATWMCVDRDGMFYPKDEEPVEDSVRCCLLERMDNRDDCRNEPPSIKEKCYNPENNTNGIKSCIDYYT